MHIISAVDFPLFCSNSARKCLILQAEGSPQKSLIVLEILRAEFYFILFFYFISFAGKNTKKKEHWRYANTSNKNDKYTNNNLKIWAGTPQQLKPITTDPNIQQINILLLQ